MRLADRPREGRRHGDAAGGDRVELLARAQPRPGIRQGLDAQPVREHGRDTFGEEPVPLGRQRVRRIFIDELPDRRALRQRRHGGHEEEQESTQYGHGVGPRK
jgi:hypothetical protein